MKLLSYDLGTGGVKASLYNQNLLTLSKSFIEYPTYFPTACMHEQKPANWLKGISESTRGLLEQTRISPEEICAIAVSGHSLVVVPIDHTGTILMEQVPIWSDTRATEETSDFFENINSDTWYLTTGNGFPAPCYSLFKLLWYKKNMPDMFKRIYKVLGSKDYINFMLTGNIYTDYSYASGTGAYDLLAHRMRKDFLNAAGISPDIFPEVIPSHHIVGTLTEEAAAFLGLCPEIPVACGGVDNSCMALGAVGTENGKIYTSLGSSSRVAVNSDKPILDPVKKPYVFAHIDEKMYTSEFSIFAGGSSLRWIRDTICMDITGADAYNRMSNLATASPVGANGVFFNPSLAGGTSQDKSMNIHGAFVGLTLGNKREDLIRAAMEGIALNLKTSIELLKVHTYIKNDILFSGGGSMNDFWMQMFADVFDMNIIKTNIDQDAASVGAAAICARAIGIWSDYSRIPQLHHVEKIFEPNKKNVARYRSLYPIFSHICDILADLGDYSAEATNKNLEN
ncbi:MAG: FGGY family carbohydrate kinase [Eubacteriales bacterium]|nr:FGGY family carbohydrate kinase [Eubacteriales bacterium]